MPVSLFRTLVALSFLTLLGQYVIPNWILPTDPSIARLLQYDGYGAPFPVLHSNALYVIPLLVTLFACIGLAFFQPWGRNLFLVTVVYWLVGGLFLGYRVSSPVDMFLGGVGALIDGVILALIFWSPLRAHFGERRP